MPRKISQSSTKLWNKLTSKVQFAYNTSTYAKSYSNKFNSKLIHIKKLALYGRWTMTNKKNKEAWVVKHLGKMQKTYSSKHTWCLRVHMARLEPTSFARCSNPNWTNHQTTWLAWRLAFSCWSQLRSQYRMMEFNLQRNLFVRCFKNYSLNNWVLQSCCSSHRTYCWKKVFVCWFQKLQAFSVSFHS